MPQSLVAVLTGHQIGVFLAPSDLNAHESRVACHHREVIPLPQLCLLAHAANHSPSMSALYDWQLAAASSRPSCLALEEYWPRNRGGLRQCCHARRRGRKRRSRPRALIRALALERAARERRSQQRHAIGPLSPPPPTPPHHYQLLQQLVALYPASGKVIAQSLEGRNGNRQALVQSLQSERQKPRNPTALCPV